MLVHPIQECMPQEEKAFVRSLICIRYLAPLNTRLLMYMFDVLEHIRHKYFSYSFVC